MPENAQVLVVDDDDYKSSNVEFYLKSQGHQVVYRASNMGEAKQFLDNGSPFDVALVDQSLTNGGKEGEILAALIKKKFPGKPVISISSTSQKWSLFDSLTANDLGLIANAITGL